MKAELLKPIKAPNEQIPFSDPRIKYPMLASIKYDGFRGVLLDGRFRSPMMKPFGNKHLDGLNGYFRDICHRSIAEMRVFDGEVWHPDISFTELSSRLRAENGDLTGVEYHVFDAIDVGDWNNPGSNLQYAHRLGYLRSDWEFQGVPSHCKLVAQQMCISHIGAEGLYAGALASGHEGIMLRSPKGPYKHNRCTHNESNLFKFKNFITVDARITQVLQRRKMRDDVERTFDPIGDLAKVNTQESYTLDEAVGALEVVLEDGKHTSLTLGRGFTYKDRQDLWRRRDSLVGLHVEFKYMPHGTKDLPRIGNVVRFRPDLD